MVITPLVPINTTRAKYFTVLGLPLEITLRPLAEEID
jgi:hypothetical protein